MSTEQYVDPQVVEQTRAQIRALVQEIAALSRQNLSDRDFFGEFLSRVVNALAAVGGAIWTTGDGGAIELPFQINFRETQILDSEDHSLRHARLVHRTLQGGEPAMVAPHSGEGEDGQPANPTDFLLLLGPIKVEQDTKAVVEIIQRAGANTSTQRGYMKFLLQMCELASDHFKNRQLRHFTDRQALWNQLESFTRVAHATLDPREACYTIANEGRRLIECDRVSVAIKHGRKCRIEAISGQDTFDKRSNTVALLTRLASAVVASGEPLWYSGDTTNLAPQVEHAVQEYVDDSHSKHVAVLPLRAPPRPKKDKEQERVDDEPGETIGAVIVEQIEDARPRDGMVQRVNVVCEHSSTALANALQHERLFLLPVWRALGKATWVVQARTLPKTLLIVTALCAAITAMVLVPYDFNLRGKGVLQPVKRRDVFAGADGTVEQVLVREGQMVRAGELLCVLRNTELETEIERTRTELNTTVEELQSVRRQRVTERRENTAADRDELANKERALEQKERDLQSQLDLALVKQKKLKVTAPIAGQITTWEVDNLLRSRPVKTGEVLMQVANPKGEWELELHMPEERMGYIAKAQHALGKDLLVTFILATDPSTSHQGRIVSMHQTAEVRGDEGNTVLVRVKIDKRQLPYLRPGAGVTGKVYCGRRAIGFVWFHDVMAFVQREVLFRLW